jgi:hypothetical protein
MNTKTEAMMELENATHDYERAHALWMKTPISNSREITLRKNEARQRYEEAYKRVYPTHIILH